MSEGTFDSQLVDDGANGHATSSDDDNLNRFLEDALGSVLRSARESAAEMLERAKRATEQRAEDTGRLWENAQREVEQMTAWRAQVEPLVHTANEKAVLIQRSVEEVPGRVAEALAPVNDALAEMDQVMAALTAALQRPAAGPTGSGGPTGGSRSLGSFGDGVAVPEPVHEWVGEADGAAQEEQVEQPAAEATDATEATEATQATEADDPVADAIWGTDGADAHEPPAGVTDPFYDADAEHPAAPEIDADVNPFLEHEPTTAAAPERSEDHEDAVSDDGPADVAAAMTDGDVPRAVGEGQPEGSAEEPSGASPPKWVDWPSSEDAAAAVRSAADGAIDASNGAGAAQPDEDDAALRSTTSQLRRAVTDIDWNDLPGTATG
jgi:hypothetical protein